MLSKVPIYIFLLFQGSLLLSQAQIKTVRLLPIQEVNEGFQLIVDSIIGYEKKCSYYTDSLSFTVSVTEYPQKSDSVYIEVESVTDKIVILNLNPIAFFRRNNHCFFITDTIPAKLFPSVGDCPILFSYKESARMDDIIIHDDSLSYWTYSFIKNEFFLLKSFSWCNK